MRDADIMKSDEEVMEWFVNFFSGKNQPQHQANIIVASTGSGKKVRKKTT